MKDALEFYRIKSQIAQFCDFDATKEIAFNIAPTFRYLVVKQLLEQTKQAIAIENQAIVLPLSKLQQTTSLYQKLQKGILLISSEINLILKNLLVGKQVYTTLVNTEYDAIKQLSDTLFHGDDVMQYIQSKIDEYGNIRSESSNKLLEIRQNIQEVQQQIQERLRKFIKENKEILMDDLIVERNQRQCVLVIVAQKNKKQGMIHGESASGLAVYFEPINTINLNNTLSQLLQQEEDELYRILLEINATIKPYALQFAQDLDTLMQLDLIMAKARYTRSIDGIIATLQKEDMYFYFKNAANPLIDKTKVVRNTYEKPNQYHTIIISGSNTGGKTVTLKTIGLFVYMTMCGIGISCEEAIVPMYDQVLIDITDEQSIEQSLSTFSSHIKNIAYFSTVATKKSLILLDELGSGSDPKDSQHLALAFLDFFRKKESSVLVTTHFDKIKQYAKNHEDVLSASVGFNLETLTPTYQYLPYQSGVSNAMFIAKQLGVSEEILGIAKQYEEEDPKQQKLEILDKEFEILRQKQRTFEKEKEMWYEAQQQLKLEQEQLIKKKLTQLQQQENQAKQAIEKLLQEAHVYLNEVKSQTVVPKIVEKMKQIEILIPNTVQAETILVGDYVEIISLKYFGIVEKIQKDKYSVNTNGRILVAKKENLRKAVLQKQKVTKTHSIEKISNSVSEVNVIGMYVEEALVIVEKAIDSALLAKRSQITIIHGVGSGKLREGIHARLKKLKHVKKIVLTNNFGASEIYLC